MRSGFTFKGKHSDSYGAVVKTLSRPIRAEAKTVFFEAPAADGAYDFSDANPYERYFYNDRFFEVQLLVGADNLRALERRVSKIARWLSGKGELVFDDMPFVKWDAAALSEIGFFPELSGHKAALTAVFRVKPFSTCMFDTVRGIIIGTDCALGSPVPLDVKACFTFECAQLALNVFDVDNIGSAPVRPVIRVASEKAVGQVGIILGGKTISVENTAAREIVIDCEKQSVADGDGNNLIGITKGEFPELSADGASEMTVIVSEDAVVTVEYVPRCVYDFDFADWGDYDA